IFIAQFHKNSTPNVRFFLSNFWGAVHKSIVSEISPEQVPATSWTSGLHEAFTREDSLGLPKLPGQESILHLHQGIYDPVEH
ncbi:hypothetical protein ACEE22_00680, partial [Streptococcus suis]